MMFQKRLLKASISAHTNSPSKPSQRVQGSAHSSHLPLCSLVTKSQLTVLASSRVPHQLQFLLPPPPSPSRSHALELQLAPAACHGDAEPDAALPQVPGRAATRPRAGRFAVLVRRSGRQRRAGDRDGLAAAYRPPVRAPQHRRSLRLQVPQPSTTLLQLV